ncbi:hypothetical protein HPP92_015040 [Vanilla planifolia]|uniref:Uncharacterized protein n=1 Tax=Vanilla planifolia TaxID=51239 RepID=A0A835QML6_VANPL|nr:hypothetical protein HPP92_015546 [Vanilla planifolia]KAG0475354.1 hypothetical protein HPP92_015040 [Vanilla planifolia]
MNSLPSFRWEQSPNPGLSDYKKANNKQTPPENRYSTNTQNEAIATNAATAPPRTAPALTAPELSSAAAPLGPGAGATGPSATGPEATGAADTASAGEAAGELDSGTARRNRGEADGASESGAGAACDFFGEAEEDLTEEAGCFGLLGCSGGRG